MCKECNYKDILEGKSIDATPNRIHVLEAIGNNSYPLTASDVFRIVERMQPINRVTVYRILDLLVEKQILERLVVGSRAAYYGIAPNEHHAPHPHFYCTVCGQLDCLHSNDILIDAAALQRNFAGEIEKVQVTVDGICKNCLKQKQN